MKQINLSLKKMKFICLFCRSLKISNSLNNQQVNVRARAKKRVTISPSRLYDLFKKQTGTSIFSIITYNMLNLISHIRQRQRKEKKIYRENNNSDLRVLPRIANILHSKIKIH